MASSEQAAKLLLRALESLGPSERRAVLEALLTGSIGRLQGRDPGSGTFGFLPVSAHHQGRSSQMEQPLMVRLPTDLHRRLRAWATTNGFSMAAIARGLIERFLDEQES
jgi:hypothetical protein